MTTNTKRKEDVQQISGALQVLYLERCEYDRKIEFLESELWAAVDHPQPSTNWGRSLR